MRNAIAIAALAIAASACVFAQSAATQPTVSVTFSDNGERKPCNDLKLELSIDGRTIPTKVSENLFIVPSTITELYANEESRRKNNIDIHVTCSGHSFEFLHLYPATAIPGYWEVGLSYPRHWFAEFRRTQIIETATWLSYLMYACDNCDPGIIESVAHHQPPPGLIARLRKSQRSKDPVTARDSAYALAVFNIDYQQNSAYLLHLLDNCLAAPNVSPDDEVCDEPLLDEIENLYLRGDRDLLLPLLRAADSPNEVVNEIGDFYADLLDRRTEETIRILAQLPAEKQDLVCKLAGQDGFSLDSPQQQRAVQQLHAKNNDAAQRCARIATDADNNVP